MGIELSKPHSFIIILLRKIQLRKYNSPTAQPNMARRPGSSRIIKPTAKAQARTTNTKGGSRSTTGKGKKRAPQDTEESNEGDDPHDDSDMEEDEVVDPRKCRKKRRVRAADSMSEERAARRKGNTSAGKQKGKATEQIDDGDDDDDDNEPEVVDMDDDVEEEVSIQYRYTQRDMTHLFDSERISISSRPRGFPTKSFPRRTRRVTFLLSLVKSLRLIFTIGEQKRSRNWRVDGAGVASEHTSRHLKVRRELTWKHREETKKTMREGRRPKRTMRACLFLGSNTTCRGHIASHHFEEYEKRCKAATPPIPLNHRCIPEAVKKARRVANKTRQLTLSFPSMKMPTEFTREGIMEAVARHIACDDQV